MMPEVEPHHHHHATGHRWLDLALPISAFFVSIISLGLAIIDGQAMERMADANARLVQANSWPFLQYVTGNQDDKGNLVINLGVHNAGVGPAKIESFEVLWQGQPVKSGVELLERCCGFTEAAPKTPAPAQKPGSVAQKVAAAERASRSGISSSFVSVMEAHQQVNFVVLPLTAKTAKVWSRLNAVRLQVQTRACSCSVFDECWTTDLRALTATEVKSVPAPRVPVGC